MPDDPTKEPHSPSDVEPLAGGATPPPDPERAGDDGEVHDEPKDAASPAAIMKRVSALADGDDAERVAEDEEAKLAERRARERTGKKKKRGLEAAASKRLAAIGTKAHVKRPMATAADADPLLKSASSFGDWAKKNQGLVSVVAGLVVVALVGALGYVAYERKREADASVQLALAVADERGRIGDPDKEDDPDRPHDPTPVFKTVADRRDAALKELRVVESKYKGTGAAILARLSEGSLLLDKEDADGALAAYTDVSTSPLAHADGEVRGRALEGMGFAYELKADAATGDAAKGDAAKAALEEAAKEYRTLENTDVDGFKELGLYHQARILQKQGNTPQAIELLKKLHERLHKDEGAEKSDFLYLSEVADDTLRSLSPTALPPKAQGFGGRPGLGGKNQLDPAMLKRMYEQMQKSGKLGTGAPPPGAPQ